MLPQSILNLIENIQKLPGVGRRGAQKLSLDLLTSSQEDYQKIMDSIEKMRTEVRLCNNCRFFAEEELCRICTDKSRDHKKICLVEKATDVLNLEKSGIYNGAYHVLEKLISPIDNIFADSTNLPDLLTRRLPHLISSLKEEENVEFIFFFKSGFSADTTIAYIKDYINEKGWQKRIILTKLAEGLPLYYNPETLDQATMVKAFEDRKTLF
jgi:recombination protein RecR